MEAPAIEGIADLADRLLGRVRADLGLPGKLAADLGRETPLAVADLQGEPSYWLVPLTAGDRLAGFLRFGLDGAAMAWGRFGQGADREALPPMAALSGETAERELRGAFAATHSEIGPPTLVHDGAVERLAWMAHGRAADGTRWNLFWTFGSSYSRPAGEVPDPLLL